MRERGHRRAEKRRVQDVSPPLVVNGWRIFVWRDFRERWTALHTHVEELCRRDPEGYRTSSAAKFLSTLRDLILKEIPANPAAETYRQGKSLSGANRNWQRAKFHQRFRLFFRFSSKHRVIIYAWLNDEDTLRKSGARTDPYVVFRAMLSRGEPPSDWDALLDECKAWTAADVEESR